MTAVPIPVEELEEDTKRKETIKTEDSKDENIVDLLKPKTDPQKVTLKYEDQEAEYIQKPLSYFGKLEFFSTLAEAVDIAMQTGLSVNGLVGGGIGAEDLTSTDSFMLAIAKLMRYAPDVLKDSYCIFLDVPFADRPWAKQAMDNLSDEEGIAIIETFIDQNYEAIENFFRERIAKVVKRVNQNRGTSQVTSSNSKPTRRRTVKK